jgi:hypothetical protein
MAEPEQDPILAALMREQGIAEPTAPGLEPAGMFSLPASKFLAYKTAQKIKRKNVKRFIRPENAQAVLDHLPEPGDHTHCLLRGDFVLGDLIPAMIQGGWCKHLRIATLGLSEYNAQTLATLVDKGHVGEITMVVSHYFEQVNKSTVYADVRRILDGKCTFIIMRSHAKVIAMETEHDVGNFHWVIEGSANLRSSDNLEQMTIYNDPDILVFHNDWIDYVRANPPNT